MRAPHTCTIIIFLFVLAVPIHAQTDDLPEGTLSFRTAAKMPEIPLEVEGMGIGRGRPTLHYEQNPSPKWGLGFDYSFFGAYLSLGSVDPDGEVEAFGKTSYQDFQIHSYLENWGVDLYYQRFQGYYLENSSSALPTSYAKDEYLLRPDLTSSFTGGDVFYVYHPDQMSLLATAANTALQTQSGGSWMLVGAVAQQKLGSDAVLAPEGLEAAYGIQGNIRKATFSTISFGGGYGYNWIFSPKWYLHFSMMVSIGPQLQDFDTLDFGHRRRVTVSPKSNGRMSFGFNGDEFFAGMSVGVDDTSFRFEDATVNFLSLQTVVFVGGRVNLL